MKYLHTVSTVSILALLFGTASFAQETNPLKVEIPAQQVGDALNLFAEQSGLQVVLYTSDASGLKTESVAGTFDNAEVALDALLASTGLEYSFLNDRTVAVNSAVDDEGSMTSGKHLPASNEVTMAQVQTSAEAERPIPENQQNQTSQEPNKEAYTPPRFEEVIVTASRRDRRLQDSTISATVVSGQQLDLEAPESFVDFANFLPSLSVVGSGRGANRITIRGVSALNQTGGATTGLYVNETPIGTDLGSLPEAATFDLESIEVLRGPQGTLFGQASMGGTIRVVTNKPDTELFSGKYRLSTTNVDNGGTGWSGAAAINIPLVSGRSGVRLVASHEEVPGYIDNPSTGESEINTNEISSFRASALFNATDNFSIEGTLLFEDTERGALDLLQPEAADFQTVAAISEWGDQELLVGNLTLSYSLPKFDIVSSSNFYDRETNTLDDDGTGFGFTIGVDNGEESFVQELRLVSTNDGPVEWLVGGYYVDQKTFGVQTISTIVDLGPPPAPQAGDALQVFEGNVNKETLAIFTDWTFSLSDTTRLSVGGRYTDENIVRTDASITAVDFDESYTVFTPKAAIAHDFSDDIMVYGTIGRGARAGGFNSFIALFDPNPSQSRFLSFEPDTLWTYELGAKSTWADDRLILNAAVFFTDWSDAQLRVNSGFFNIPATTNAGDVEVRGIEIEATATPTESLSLGLTASFTDAEFAALDPTNTLPVVEGDQLPYTFDQNISAFVEYRRPISNSGFDFSFNANVNHVGDGFAAPGSDLAIGDFTITNISLGLSSDKTRIVVFADNVSDERGLVNRSQFSPLVSIMRPRSIGIRVLGNF